MNVSADNAEQKKLNSHKTFTALQHRNFRLFWTGQLLSLIGTWMDSTGQSWLVLKLTHNALALGIVGALQFLPMLFFTLFGGVLADRLPKRRVLVFTQAFLALQAAVLCTLVFTGKIQLWHIYTLAILYGLTNSIDMPTRQSFVSEMVDRESLPNAIALNSSAFNMARIVGPGIAGLLIAQLGEGPLFLINAISFLPVIGGLLLININHLFSRPRKTDATSSGTLQSLWEGLVYVRRTPAVLIVIAVVGVVSLFGINFNVALPLIATDALHVGSAGFGFISSAFGVGSLIAALWLAWGNKSPDIGRMLFFTICFAVVLGLFGLSHWYPLSILLIAGTGFMQISFAALANTIIQTVSPDHLRGRIMSVYMLVFNGTTPIGNLFIGGLANSFGISIALVAGAGVSLIAAIAGWLKRAPAMADMARTLSIDAEKTVSIETEKSTVAH
ncbi:MAG TPA: MFS transporter [Dictyobacter sp.]|nr:MFS transporter [Dictyobacter sp.]